MLLINVSGTGYTHKYLPYGSHNLIREQEYMNMHNIFEGLQQTYV